MPLSMSRHLKYLVSGFTFCVLLSLSASTIQAENWPAWRGPTGNGISHETHLPIEWTAEKNVAWKIDLPGAAGSTPVVWDDHIFLTTVDEEKLLVMCFDTTGKQLWSKQLGEGNLVARKDEGNSASSSPVTDGMHIWVTMGHGEMACYDFAGKEIWAFNLQDRYGPIDIQFGFSTTPVLDGDRLYMQLLHGDMKTSDTGYSKIICLDKITGKEVYAVDRKSEATHENKHSYASAVIAQHGTLKYLLVHGGDYITAHQLEDGKEIWRCGDMNDAEKYDKFLRFVASPVSNDGLVVAPTAKHGPIIGINLDSHGDVTGKPGAELWRLKKTPDVPSPLIYDGQVYMCMQDGSFYSVDGKTGEAVYPPKRLFNDRYRASPVYADGKIYCTSRKGVITVIKAGKDFEVLHENAMEEEMSSSPAIANGTIYLRTFPHLWAIREMGN
jgi:outer membrane protein assembly factor BamB